MMVGKWHLAKDSDCSAAGPQHSWPCQRGFERFYGILDAFTNQHHPHRIVEDNHLVEVDRYPDDYYFTDDLTDHAISMIRERKASNPEQPFFLYFAHGAVHAPLHARAADIEKYRGRYDGGWDQLRAERFARQQELGIVPDGLELPPRNTEANHDVQAWDDLPAREQQLFAAPHGGLRGDGRSHRPERGPAGRGAGGAGRARQHDHRVPLRQRRFA